MNNYFVLILWGYKVIGDWMYELEYDRYGTDEDDRRTYICSECGQEVSSDEIHEDICDECWEKIKEEE